LRGDPGFPGAKGDVGLTGLPGQDGRPGRPGLDGVQGNLCCNCLLAQRQQLINYCWESAVVLSHFDAIRQASHPIGAHHRVVNNECQSHLSAHLIMQVHSSEQYKLKPKNDMLIVHNYMISCDVDSLSDTSRSSIQSDVQDALHF